VLSLVRRPQLCRFSTAGHRDCPRGGPPHARSRRRDQDDSGNQPSDDDRWTRHVHVV